MSMCSAPPSRPLNLSPIMIDSLTRAATPSEASPTKRSPTTPQLLHKLHHPGSVLSLAVSEKHIFAGTQNHTIHVWDSHTFESVAVLTGHEGSVLCLHLSHCGRWLISSAGDSMVHVWDVRTLRRVCIIWSSYDVGDMFSVVYAPETGHIYLGAQNTSIQWFDLDSVYSPRTETPIPIADESDLATNKHARRGTHKFFDSRGPGGVLSRRPSEPSPSTAATPHHQIPPDQIIQYAHYGYIYSFILGPGRSGGAATLFSGGGDGEIKLWRLDRLHPEPAPFKTLSAERDDVGGVLSLSLQDTILYAGMSNGDIRIWDLDTAQLLRHIRSAHSGTDVLCTTVLDNTAVYTAGADGRVQRWGREGPSEGWEAHRKEDGSEGLVLAAAVVKGGNQQSARDLLVTGGNDEWLKIWDVRETEEDFIDGSGEQGEGEEDDAVLFKALAKLVSLRTISGSSGHVEECRRGATFLKNLLRRLGAEATLIPCSGNPVVLGRFKANSTPVTEEKRKNVLFYGHYDVIGACENGKDSSNWHSDPYELTGQDGYLYGRGVSDNKGPVLAAIFAASELMAEKNLSVDVTFVIEGEEESGSKGFAEAIRSKKDVIGDVDLIILSNSYWLDDSVPCLTYGLRGVIHATVKVSGHRPDAHSGVEGGAVREPLIDLINLSSKLTDDAGKICLPRFYDAVRPVTSSEEKFYEAIIDKLKPDSSHHDLLDMDALMARWRFPSLTIHHVNVSGPGNETVIPKSASAAVSIRIVPDQSLEEITADFEAYLRAKFAEMGSKNVLNVTIDHQADWWLGDTDNTAYKVLEGAIREEWNMVDEHPLYIREGGSIPVVRWLEREFGAAATHFPCGQRSDSAHLNDERIRLVNLIKGKRILKRTFQNLA
ncbi:glutathione degradosome [Saitoella complicata NRRL Y-17804]|uniref:glutathione degradosome n=1 Tax=Saitoella complicata (strain BCRC 22490 / CBS 7301 / JCM 7358 / NBRC 10748 / NRRL Y-17804) TaxID=698492 RepID=UPI00086702E9|nr:glutathione degradosome [Saitoella complicata NRRL Y-17804]ODQ52565.1 glutathione degradosome [Saitoella complicata NRRL Y-17804]